MITYYSGYSAHSNSELKLTKSLENRDSDPHFTVKEVGSEGKYLAQSHTPSKWQGRDSSPGMSSPKLLQLHLRAKYCLQYLLQQSEMISHQESQI